MKPKEEHGSEQLVEALMRSVLKTAGQRLLLVMQNINDTEIAPRDDRIAQLEAEIIRLGGAVPPAL